MLRIKKRHTALKGMVAGSVAFAIGLTSTAALIGNSYRPESFTFSKEQSTNTTPKEAVPIKTDDSSADKSKTATATSGSSGAELTQPAGSTWAPAPSAVPQPTSASSTTTVTAAPSGGASTTTTTTTGGMGGGGGTTSGSGTDSSSSPLSPVTDPVTDVLQGSTCKLLEC